MRIFNHLLHATLLFVIMAFQTAMAYDFEYNGIYYNKSGANAIVTYQNNSSPGYSNLSGDIVIPSTVENEGITYSVTSIGEGAFRGCTNLTSITIPNTVTSIGDYAFRYCSGLTGTLCIPDLVNSIGKYAFQDCSGLTGTLIIPNLVTSIGDGAFSGCSGLSILTIGESVATIHKSAFSNCSNLITLNFNAINCSNFSSYGPFNNIQLNTINIGENVQNIPSYFAYKQSKLTSITIPNSATNIGSNAFYGCSGLTGELNIPDAVTTISSYAFYGCSGFSSLTIGESVATISESAFYDCSNFTTLNYNAINCYNFNVNTNRASFDALFNTITIGENVQSIPSYFAYKQSKLTSITIPNSVTTIGRNAFCNCSDLKSVTIGKSVTTMGIYVFEGCSALNTLNYNAIAYSDFSTNTYERPFYGANFTTIVIGDSVQRIPAYFASSSSNLTSLVIGKSVTYFGKDAFSNCKNLLRLHYNAINCAINNNVFNNDISLVSLHFGNSVEYIPARLPSFNLGSKVLSLPNSVVTIVAGSFNGNCGGVTIGDNISNIDAGTFSDGINTAYVSSMNPLPCSEGAFINPQTLNVPAGCRAKYLMSDGWCEFENIIEGNYYRVTELTLNTVRKRMRAGDIFQLIPTIIPNNYSSSACEWWSTNTTVASVSSSGLVTAITLGEADICCVIDNEMVICHIQVVASDFIADSIQLNYSELLLTWDNIVDLTATIYPDGISQDVNWTVPQNHNIYTRVVGNRLRVMAMRSGEVTVTATSVADPNVSANCIITIQIPDLNDDTYLNIGDVTALINYLLSGDDTSVNVVNADVNRDGYINISDVTHLINMLLTN